jgi:carboxylate-amine ligase
MSAPASTAMDEHVSLPDWAQWSTQGAGAPYSVGIEEEVMLLEPGSWELTNRIDDVLAGAPAELSAQLDAETHGSAAELRTSPHPSLAEAITELSELRGSLDDTLTKLGMRAATAGTHPTALWGDVVVSRKDRYRKVYASMRELARREPTFALHVHVGLHDGETGVRVLNGLRAHLPLLLALSANSPFWQGRDSGLASARTPVFGAFPRVGIPREYAGYSDYVTAVDTLIRFGAIAEPTFLWWDVRLQPRFGTIELRILDAQTSTWQTGALVALIQSLCRLLAEEDAETHETHPPEVLDENRFLASRDGVEAHLIRPALGARIPVPNLVAELIGRCEPHAAALGCESELDRVRELSRRNGSINQLAVERRVGDLPHLIESLADEFRGSRPPAS